MVVRDPVQRFLSTCQAVGLGAEEVVHFLPKWRDSDHRMAVRFCSQASILRKVDYLVGLPWLAEWLNTVKLPGRFKEGVLFPCGRPRPVPPWLEEALLQLYPRDFYLFGQGSTRVPLWAPFGSEPRFIWGNCSECRAKANRENPG